MSDTKPNGGTQTGTDPKRRWLQSVLQAGDGTPPQGPVIGASRQRANAVTERDPSPQPQGPVIGASRQRANAVTERDPSPQPQGPVIGTARAPDRQEVAFNARLREAMPAIEIARGLAAVNDKAATAQATMEDSLAAAFDAAKAKKFEVATQSLAAAVAAADEISNERVAMREAFLKRQTELDAKFARLPERVGQLATPPAAVTQALKTAGDAQAAAQKAGEAEPEDWPEATRRLDGFDKAIGDLGTACTAEANLRGTAFTARFDLKKGGKPVGADQVKLRTAYLAEQKKLAALIAGGDGLGALEAAPKVETALAAFEAAASPSDSAKATMAADALRAVTALSDEQLAAKSMSEKAELALNLCANGRPASGPALDQLCRVYRAAPPDPAFLAKRDEERTKIADEVSKIAGVANLFNANGRVDRRAWNTVIADPDKVRDLLKEVHAAQVKVLGLPEIPVTTYSQPSSGGSTSMGGYVFSDTPNINLNAHRDAVSSPTEALITILHETFHAQQHMLIKQLMSGELGPDDPLYPQVLMFASNTPGVGYLPPAVSQTDYEAQPLEVDAEEQGTKAANAVLLQIKRAKTPTV